MDNSKVRILVVDDEIDLEQLMLQRMRREVRHGRYEFEFVHNGAEALEWSYIQIWCMEDLKKSGVSG